MWAKGGILECQTCCAYSVRWDVKSLISSPFIYINIYMKQLMLYRIIIAVCF